MRPKCVQNVFEMCSKCVRNASKTRPECGKEEEEGGKGEGGKGKEGGGGGGEGGDERENAELPNEMKPISEREI